MERDRERLKCQAFTLIEGCKIEIQCLFVLKISTKLEIQQTRQWRKTSICKEKNLQHYYKCTQFVKYRIKPLQRKLRIKIPTQKIRQVIGLFFLTQI